MRTVFQSPGFGLLWCCLLLSCGSQVPEKDADFPGIETPEQLVAIDHPNLNGLEPVAAGRIKRFQQALAPMEKINQKDATAAEAYGELGVAYFSFRYKDAAESAFRNALVIQPDDAVWNYYLGRLYEDRSEPRKSAFFLKRANRLDPARISIKVAYAEALRVIDQHEEAAGLFREVLAKEPGHVIARFGLGQIAAAAGRHEEAVEQFKSVLQAQPRATAVHYPLGLSLRAVGRVELATQFLDARGDIQPYRQNDLMMRVDGPRAEAHYRMAETLRLAGKASDSLQHYALVIDLLPEDPNPRMGQTLALIQAERFLDAAIALRDNLMDFPQQAVFRHMMARLLAASPDERVRDGERALQILRPLTQGRLTPEIAETLAMAFAEVGLFDDAIKAQNKAIGMAEELEDESLVDRLKDNLLRFQKGEAIWTPWPANDPLFTKVTYPAQSKG